MPVVVGTKAFKETDHQPAILRRSVGELMTGPVVFADGNGNILVNVERLSQQLGENIYDIVVAVRPVVEFDPKGVLPLLRLQNVTCIGRVKNESFEVQLAHPAQFGSGLEGRIQIVTDAIGALDEPNLGIKVWPDFAATGYQLEPVGLKIEARTLVGLSGRKTWRSCLCRKTMHHQIPKEDQACICAGCLVEIVKGIS